MNRAVPLPLTPALVGNALTMAASLTAGAQAGTGRRVTTPAGELAVRDAGQGTVPLLLWHGLYAEASMFDPLVKHLAPDYRLLLISAPGHGESGLPALPLSIAMSGAAVLAVLDAFGLERAAVLGCSWGGLAGGLAGAASYFGRGGLQYTLRARYQRFRYAHHRLADGFAWQYGVLRTPRGRRFLQPADPRAES
ncbi:MAG: alpha/beta fold hydrolase [Roseomonas sp.]|nr:alpha/beta fold hydrolase [Roseomonas sp.]MCA3428574.1 alpha/beta fold hydrolase [Roseomonas sp.]MCA3432470.1 alpha/beta fold hydrolase [Roseomonas sp.]